MPAPKAYKLYRNAVKENLAPYFANWLPGTPQQLGNYGTMQNGVFVAIGNIKDDFGIDFEIAEDPHTDTMEFYAGGNVSVSYDTSVDANGIAKGSLKLKFEREKSVYFQSVDARANRIKNKLAVGEAILQGMKNGTINWKRRYILVTDIVTGGRTIAAVAAESGATIEFGAKSGVPASQIPADASIGLSINSSQNIGYTVNGQAMDILLGLSKVRRRFFNPVFVGVSGSSMLTHLSMLEESPEVEDAEPMENLTFGQLSGAELTSEL